MADSSLPARCLAVDFGGTLAARSDGALAGVTVARALHDGCGWEGHPAFAEALSLVMKLSFQRDRVTCRQTSFSDILREAARQCGATLPDATEATVGALFDRLPDARVDQSAALAIRTLAEQGLRLVLASNTRWPESARRRTLRAAGIERYFHALVLSSELGLRKPHPGFYDAVLSTADCPPGQVLFVGDTADKDLDPPQLLGMRSMLVAPVWAPHDLTDNALPMFKDVPGLLGAAR